MIARLAISNRVRSEPSYTRSPILTMIPPTISGSTVILQDRLFGACSFS